MAPADELRTAIRDSTPFLLAIDDAKSQRAPAPGKWCPREVIGHLIDSASVNQQRFVRARGRDDLLFDGYDQDAWVEVQRYRDAPWRELVELWRRFNLQLARVIDALPAEELRRPRARHSLDEIAFRAWPRSEPATLDYLVRDYVAHLHHHLRSLGA